MAQSRGLETRAAALHEAIHTSDSNTATCPFAHPHAPTFWQPCIPCFMYLPTHPIPILQGERNGAPRITLRRMSPEDAARLEAEAYKTRAAALREAAGFAAVFDMMRASGKPGVGHNCMFDVAYALQNFAVGDLPGRWSEFKALAAYWHSGGLYDTK